MSVKSNDLRKLALDTYKNSSLEFEGVSGNDAMRNAIKDAMGGEELSYYTYEAHKTELFQIIATAVDAVMPTLLTDQFSNLADIRNVSLNDKPLFQVSDPRILRVGHVAAGNQDLRRQTITGKNFTIETDWYGMAVYAEFEQFMAGEIDWTDLVNRITQGFAIFLEEKIGTALNKAYSALNTPYKVDVDGSLDGILNLVELVQVHSGKKAAIYGTKFGLGKLAKLADASGNMKDEMNKIGYLGTISGVPVYEIPQAVNSKDEFAIDDKTLLVLPEGEKIVGVVIEGDTIVNEPDRMDRNDMQLGFKTLEKLGVEVLQMKVFGVATLK
jgi:hypothetical protein